MKVLLDTCTFLWAVHSPEKLSAQARSRIADTQNEICLSCVSFWEISIKFRLGKLDLKDVDPPQLREVAEKAEWPVFPLSPEETASFYLLPLVKEHRDPFDRMLVHLSVRRGLPLISSDRRLSGYEPFGLKLIS